MSEDGKVYSFAIKENAPKRDDYFLQKRPQFTGDLLLDQPICVKDLPPVKMIATGLDHILVLDRKGQVHAMGDDTFGQCGQGGDKR